MLESLKDENGQIKKPILYVGLGGAALIGYMMLKSGGGSSTTSQGQSSAVTPDLSALQSALQGLNGSSGVGDGTSGGSGVGQTPTSTTPVTVQPVTAQPVTTQPVASQPVTSYVPGTSTSTVEPAPAPVATKTTVPNANLVNLSQPAPINSVQAQRAITTANKATFGTATPQTLTLQQQRALVTAQKAEPVVRQPTVQQQRAVVTAQKATPVNVGKVVNTRVPHQAVL